MFSPYTPEICTTAFGAALWEIIRFPIIPEKVESLVSYFAGKKTTVSKLTQSEYEVVKVKWEDILKTKEWSNDVGLSLREFMTMVAELFGVSTTVESEWPLSMSSVHRLITTGDSKFTNPAVNLNRATLAFISQFSSSSYESLLKLGEQTVIEFKRKRESLREERQEKPVLADALKFTSKPIVYLDAEAKVTTETKANNLRTIVHQYLLENGCRELLSHGVNPKDLLEIAFEPKPNVSLTTLRLLIKHLKIDPELFLNLVLEDQESL